MSEENKPRAVEIIADDFSGGIGVAPEPIVITRTKKYKVKKRTAK